MSDSRSIIDQAAEHIGAMGWEWSSDDDPQVLAEDLHGGGLLRPEWATPEAHRVLVAARYWRGHQPEHTQWADHTKAELTAAVDAYVASLGGT